MKKIFSTITLFLFLLVNFTLLSQDAEEEGTQPTITSEKPAKQKPEPKEPKKKKDEKKSKKKDNEKRAQAQERRRQKMEEKAKRLEEKGNLKAAERVRENAQKKSSSGTSAPAATSGEDSN